MLVYAIFLVPSLGLLGVIFYLLFGGKKNRAETDAKGFARILVTEIKLYHHDKLQKGLENNKLYQSLRDEIDEAAKMYRQLVPTNEYFKHFNAAVINILADGDKHKLGTEFNKTLE